MFRLPLRALWALAAILIATPVVAQPYGLTTRSTLGAYLGGLMPSNTPTGGTPAPALLSQTGAFSDTPNMVPHAGLVPFRVNSALWSDAALKTRWIGLPYNSAMPEDPAQSPKITFTAEGEWTFPQGTVFVKHFELVVNENTGAKRRLETRIMVKKQGGYVYGRSYRWRPDNLEADVVEQNAPVSQYQELITVTNPDGVTTRQQTWNYPRPQECLTCHTNATNGVLGPRTYQLNGDMLYTASGVTDNQLRTMNHLGMFATPLNEGAIAGYLKAVAITDTSATLENRVRSYLAANCSHCHRPDDTGRYDARYTTPVLDQQIFGRATGLPDKLRRFTPADSRIIARDSVNSAGGGMPPLAKDVVDDYWIDTVTEMVNYAYDVASVVASGDSTKVRVTFDRAVDPATATAIGNYALDNGITVSAAVIGADPKMVTLTVSPLSAGTTYTLTVNRVKESQAPQNPIWPNTAKTFDFTPLNPTADEDNDGVPNGVEATEGLNAFVKDNDIFASARLFAMQQYRDFLGREGEAAGIQYYIDQINGGTITREQGIEQFLAAPEFTNGLPPIIRLYFAFFGRIPDYGGLQFQVAAFRAGTPLALIAQNFYNAPEFTNTYGSLTNDQYINLVYQNVLGRAPDPAGYDYYFTRLESGALTKGQMMIGFSESPEFQQLKDNASWAISVYVGLLRRTPEQAGLNFYVNLLDQGTPRSAIIPGFFNSAEYHNRFLP